MTWKESIDAELNRAWVAQRAQNDGRVRVSARRAAGIAIDAWLRRRALEPTRSVVERLQSFGLNEAVPLLARDAAHRLAARLDEDFQSLSKNPIDDALIIITFVEEELRKP